MPRRSLEFESPQTKKLSGLDGLQREQGRLFEGELFNAKIRATEIMLILEQI